MSEDKRFDSNVSLRARWEPRALLLMRGLGEATDRVAAATTSLRSNKVFERASFVYATPTAVIAVFTDPETALGAARELRRRKLEAGVHVRYGFYWGDVLVGPDGQPCGGEPAMLGSLLDLTEANRACTTSIHRLPNRDRILLPAGALASLPEDLRTQFVPAGHYRLGSSDEPIEVWTESLKAFLGREPTNSERLFGVESLHHDTVLDHWWERRTKNTQRAMK